VKLLGHEKAQKLLARARPQSLLITGPEGVGRRALARWFAYGLNCERGFPPCGQCQSCRMTPHPDYLEIAPKKETQSGEAAKRPLIHVDQIVPRTSGETNLLEWIETRPRFARRVAVINGAEHLTEAAANALLKTLEEPPAHAHVVLIAPSRSAILPTLASRVQEVRLAPLPRERLLEISDDPDLLTFAEGAPGRLFWAMEHPEVVRDLARASDRLTAGLEGESGLAAARDFLRLMDEGLDPTPFLARAFKGWGPAAEAAALEALFKLKEARAAYVGAELLAAWWHQTLRRIHADLRARAL